MDFPAQGDQKVARSGDLENEACDAAPEEAGGGRRIAGQVVYN